jgi:hypothetical protein
MTNPPSCNLELLLFAAKYTYSCHTEDQGASKIEDNDKLIIDTHNDPLHFIKAQGYTVDKILKPKDDHGDGATSLTAVRLVAKNQAGEIDQTLPVILAFKGTTSHWDILTDAFIASSGTASKAVRLAAFEFLQASLNQYPKSDHVSVGHSLGGHLASYCTIKTLATREGLGQREVLCRTFNTAPGKSKYQSIFKTHPFLKKKIINYRLREDFVSRIPLQSYLGEVFSFAIRKPNYFTNPIKAHYTDPMHYSIPLELWDSQVGASSTRSLKENQFIEEIKATILPYSQMAEGRQSQSDKENAKILNELMALLIKKIDAKRYQQAEDLLAGIKVQGLDANKLLITLRDSFEEVIQEQKFSSMKEKVHQSSSSQQAVEKSENSSLDDEEDGSESRGLGNS